MSTGSLDGYTIIVTRTREQASQFSTRLQDLGARVIEIPTIEIVECDSPDLTKALASLASYDWVIFTSVNGVEAFFNKVAEEISEPPDLPKVCTIGPATSDRVRSFGFTVDLQPELYQAEGIIEELSALHSGVLSGLRFLLPRARVARTILPDTVRSMGATVDVIPVYDTVLPESSRKTLRTVLDSENPDLVTFTSSSTVRNFVQLAETPVKLSHLDCAAIGPITAKTAEELGLRIVIMPEKATINALVSSIESYFGD